MSVGEIGLKAKAFFLHENVVLLVLAVIVGVAGAHVALGFREGISLVNRLFYQVSAENLTSRLTELPWWQVMLAPALGGLLVGQVNTRLMKGRRGQGVGNIIEVNALHGAKMDLKQGLSNALANTISIGAGASIGREGTILHLTSTVTTWCAARLRLQQHHQHILLGCAVAAGMAASFNAPIAGVFFALEVVLRHYALTAFAPVVISSVIGTMITRIYYGDFPAYILPHYDVVTFWEFPAFLLLGIVCGFAAILFMWTVFTTEDIIRKVKLPAWLKPAIGGLTVGGIALFLPHVMGVGYETTTKVLNESLGMNLTWLLGLIVFKTVATAVSIGSGFGGGVSSPSIFVGTIVGSAFGTVAAMPFPDLGIHTGLYAIVGMASTSAAVLGAPISCILIVFELLGDFKITIGVMSGAAVATLLVQSILGKSYYLWRLQRRGIELEGARAMQILRQQVVGDVAGTGFHSVEATTKLMEVIDFLHTLPEGAEAVVVEDGYRFVGTIQLEDVKDVAFDPLANQDALEAQSFVRLYPEVLTADQTLARAIAVMSKWKADRLPVVSDVDSMSVVGMVDKNTLLEAYVDALLQAEAESHGGGAKSRT
ncbi:chloride channel protein [Aestuariispira ectoiniformans]|uniref:chloride channel protein n=1 Tax=Aestuariispira ectoiniformans TaxID=2775080 RepID=UPI00223B677A|nr:chloride channel protein [Aestuariispira ectoiniformans]